MQIDRKYISLMIVGCAIFLGALLRGVALYTWDGEHTLHPDERFLVYTVYRLQVPDQWQSYGNNDCVVDGKVPAPSATRDLRGTDLLPPQWEPSRASGCNSLNPRNFGWSQRFVYGAWPTTLVRVVSDWIYGRDATPRDIRDTGRTIAWMSEVIAIVLVYWLARAVLVRRASAWAAFAYALAILPVQLSHFFTVDAIVSPWVVGALGVALRLHQQRWRDWILFAVCVAIASATRITLISMAGLAFIVWMLHLRQWGWQTHSKVIIAILVGVVVLWIADPTWWQGGWFEQRWLADVMAAGRIVSGDVDTPPTFQWVDAVPWLYPWWQLSWWGLGVAIAGSALYGMWMMLGRRWRPAHLLLIWIVVFFGWQGGVFGMTMRYYLPIYAGLCVYAFVILTKVAPQWRRIVVAVLIVPSVVAAVAWHQLYAEPHPRIAASTWMYAHIPEESTIAVEQWDDALPLVVDENTPGRYTYVELPVFAPDRPSKFLTIDDERTGMIDRIAEADYIVLSSARAHAVVTKMPLRFPVMTQYYTMLFDGRLGYELVYQAARWPRIGPWWWDTRVAEEALSVYDHPQVLIFANRERLDAPTLAQRMLDDIRWSDIAHTSTKHYRAYPDLGVIPDDVWNAPAPMAWSWRGGGGWSMWLLLVDGLMLMLVPWLGRWRDHGVTIGRALGMLLLIGVSALPMVLSMTIIVLGVGIPIGLWGWWRHWRQIVSQVRQQWHLAVGGEVLWLVMVGIAAWWAGGASLANDWWRQVAIINQQMYGMLPVVADPWLAGFRMLDAGGVWRAAAVLGMISGSDGHLALTMMIATATGVMAQILWYACVTTDHLRVTLLWRGFIIVAVLSVGNLVPLVRATLGIGDPLWSASHMPDVSGWIPMTWLIAGLRADTPWVWHGVWWALAAVVVWRRAWWELVVLLALVVALGGDMVWWVAMIGSTIAIWHWWGQRRAWLMLVGMGLLLRSVVWQLPQGSATMLLLHLWPLVGWVGWLVWQQAQRRQRDVFVAVIWGMWGIVSAWLQLPLWILMAGWGVCASVLGRRYGWQIWAGIGAIGVVSMVPIMLTEIGYQLITLAVWGIIAWWLLTHARRSWWLAPALMWVVWSASIVRPTLSDGEKALATQVRSIAERPPVLVDTDINRAQRVAAASGSVLWVAPPSQLDERWLDLGWRDAIRQRWQQTLDTDARVICAHDARLDVVLTADGVARCP